MTLEMYVDIIFAIERTHTLIYYSPQRTKVRHEYFELSDRINLGPTNAAVIDMHNRDVSLYDCPSLS